jgi:NAD(P)-dependent dehydrogenase (short-subunit alcohol dehydrogenase family)
MSASNGSLPNPPAPGRRVLVTGGSSGLGLALVEQFVAAGDRVLVTDLAAEARATGLGGAPATLPDGTAYHQLDVRSDADWSRARDWVQEHWGGLDLLVNNAGIAQGGRIDRVTMEDWQLITDVNLLGVVRGCRTFVPMMKAQGSGQIVNTASMAGLVHPPAMSSYNVVKAGVVALSETLQHELKPFGISVSVVCPSFFRTNLGDSFNDSDPLMREAGKRLVEGSRASAAEVAGIVLEGLAKRKPVILTDREGRLAHWAKRLARPLHNRQMAAVARKLRHAETSPGEQAEGEPAEGGAAQDRARA